VLIDIRLAMRLKETTFVTSFLIYFYGYLKNPPIFTSLK